MGCERRNDWWPKRSLTHGNNFECIILDCRIRALRRCSRYSTQGMREKSGSTARLALGGNRLNSEAGVSEGATTTVGRAVAVSSEQHMDGRTSVKSGTRTAV